MKNQIETIYVALLNEGTPVWRPVDAELIEDNQYRTISRNDLFPFVAAGYDVAEGSGVFYSQGSRHFDEENRPKRDVLTRMQT